MDEFFSAVFFTCLLFLIVWVNWSGIQKTPDGRFYLKTHGNYYELVSDKPIIIKEFIYNIEKK